MEKIQCWTCREYFSKDFFTPLPDGWYSRSGHRYSCRMCSLEYPVKYKRKKGKVFTTLVPYEPDWDEKMSDFFRR